MEQQTHRANVEYHQGSDARLAGIARDANPYTESADPDSRRARWALGWDEAAPMQQQVNATVRITYSADARDGRAILEELITGDVSRLLDADEGNRERLEAQSVELLELLEEAAIYGGAPSSSGRYAELERIATDCMESSDPNVASYHRGAAACARVAEAAEHPGARRYNRGREAEQLLAALDWHEHCGNVEKGGELTTAERLLVAAMIAARAEGGELAVPQLAPSPALIEAGDNLAAELEQALDVHIYDDGTPPEAPELELLRAWEAANGRADSLGYGVRFGRDGEEGTLCWQHYKTRAAAEYRERQLRTARPFNDANPWDWVRVEEISEAQLAEAVERQRERFQAEREKERLEAVQA
jgi:hypothetical protein